MLTENNIIDAVCKYLNSNGYEIKQSLNTMQQGIDIIATKSNNILKIEAKGATSSKKSSNRYGKVFNRNQVKTHIAMALYAISKFITADKDKKNIKYAFALPCDDNHISVINDIREVINTLNINIFWVQDTMEVTENTFE